MHTPYHRNTDNGAILSEGRTLPPSLHIDTFILIEVYFKVTAAQRSKKVRLLRAP